jgi:hypothetical protein
MYLQSFGHVFNTVLSFDVKYLRGFFLRFFSSALLHALRNPSLRHSSLQYLSPPRLV